MDNLPNAIDALKRMALQYQEIANLAASLEELGGIKQARDELTAQIDVLRTQFDQETEALNNACAQRDIATREAEETRQKIADDMQAAAAEIAEMRKTRAAAATAKAEAILAAAREEADAKLGAMGGQLSVMQAKLDDLTKEVAKAEEARDAAASELQLITKRIADAKETVQKMVGA